MSRHLQTALWIVLGPTLGLVQGSAAFLPVYLQHSPGEWTREGVRVFLLISLVYGAGWFIPALLLSDWIFLRRGLSARELKRYLLMAAFFALLSGVVLGGILLMVGYPLSAVATLCIGYGFRRKLAAGGTGEQS